MKTLREVIEKAVRNKKFADQLMRAAQDAVRDGVGSDSWRQLMTYFAQSPSELDELSDPESIADPRMKCRAFKTPLAFTSPICPNTIFSDDEMGQQARMAKKAPRPAKTSTKAKRTIKSGAKAKRSAK